MIYVPTFYILRPSKIYPNWDFWFENMPSGNPAWQAYLCTVCLIEFAAIVCFLQKPLFFVGDTCTAFDTANYEAALPSTVARFFSVQVT
jgi:hypothetical protein